MNKNKTHIGEKYNHLTIKKEAPDILDENGNKIRQVWCECDCGNEELQLLNLYYVIYGSVKGCSKCKSKRMSESQKDKRKKINSYKFLKDCVYIYPQDNLDIYTIVDYKWYEYLKNYYVWPKKDRDNGYYWFIKFNGKNIKIHNIIGGLKYDHINRNKSDNREENLRPSSNAENARNRTVTKISKSGLKGVFIDKRGKYTAQIRKEGKLYYLGTFKDKIEAGIEYDKASLYLFGEFACLNFPDNNYDMTNYKLPNFNLKDRKKIGKSGYKGVQISGNKFKAIYKSNVIGIYSSAKEAAIAYDNYLKENNIEGRLNFE